MKNIIIVVLTIIGMCVYAQKNLPFEPAVMRKLSGSEIAIPGDVKGKYTILFLAFSEKSKESLVTWAEPVWNTFMVKNPLNIDPYDVNLYMGVMLFGFTQLAMPEVEKMLRKSFNPDWHPYILIHKGSLKPYSDEPDFKKRHVAHIFLFDDKGNLLLHETGDYAPDKLQKIQTLIEGE
ncbi:MAG: hypothetical protein NW207_12275 [Cytophagales bacterium]|nr:hypothetical protein [Cytophagales bacterium]